MNVMDEYLESRVMTAKPEELHLLVLDGAIRQTTLAEVAVESKDFETAHFSLNSAREFVVEILSGLDEEQSAEIVANLKSLFAYVYRCLNDADLYHDVEKVQSALKVLRLHRETWQQLILQRKQELGAGTESTAIPEPTGRSWTS